MQPWLACVCAVLAGTLVSAQSPRTPQTPTFRSTTSLVLVDVTVLDKDGKPVSGLTADDFQVKLDGQVRPVRAVTYEQIANPLAPPRSLWPNKTPQVERPERRRAPSRRKTLRRRRPGAA
jgi:hypothetical protein